MKAKNYNGLTDKEAKMNLEKYGKNVLKEEKKTSWVTVFASQFKDFMILLLAIATVVSAFMGDYVEAGVISAIVFLNAIIGFVQELRTEKTLEALKELAAPEALVKRNGEFVSVKAEELVIDDLVYLEAGDRVPADCYVIETHSLSADESMLTGESEPISKKDSQKLFMGSTIVSGHGLAVVEKTGMDTEMGKIAGMLGDAKSEPTPLQIKLNKMGKVIGILCLIICAMVSVLGVVRGENLLDMLLSGISLAVAAVPEGMPAIVSVALAIGVRRMLAKRALIRRLPAVETLGCADVICSDKTGTITENKMTILNCWIGDKMYDAKDKRCEEIINQGVLCCNCREEKGGVFTSADPTEKAFIMASKCTRELFEVNKRVHEVPFDSKTKYMCVVYRAPNGEHIAVMKGAVDVVIERCSSISTGKRAVERANQELAQKAMRVLAVARKRVEAPFDKNLEDGFELMGLVGMMDPPRKEVVAAMKSCKEAGIRTVMITGDHKETAVAVGKEIGLDASGVLTGAELDKLSDDGFVEAVEKTSIYARVSPEHKLKIVKALKQNGHVVAMTGDGVNDAPAVKEADIGVAMGKYGTNVTRQGAAMVLMDDNYATIVHAVEEGRVIYSNIRKFIRYLLACNIGEVLTVFLAMLIGLPLPLLPIQVLWINLVTDGLPALALGFEPADKDTMTRSPRKKHEGIFSDGLLSLIVVRGIWIGLASVGIFAYTLSQYHDLSLARTAAFVMLIFTQLVHVFQAKSEKKSIFRINLFNNAFLLIAATISLSMVLAVVNIPSIAVIFGNCPMPSELWYTILGVIGGYEVLSVIINGIVGVFSRH